MEVNRDQHQAFLKRYHRMIPYDMCHIFQVVWGFGEIKPKIKELFNENPDLGCLARLHVHETIDK